MTGARGEVTLDVGGTVGDRPQQGPQQGQEVRILFTNRALAEAERALGKAIIGVAQGFVQGTSGITEAATLLRAGMEAARKDARQGGQPVTLSDAYDVLDAVGFARVSQAVMTAVAAVLAYSAETSPAPPWEGGEGKN